MADDDSLLTELPNEPRDDEAAEPDTPPETVQDTPPETMQEELAPTHLGPPPTATSSAGVPLRIRFVHGSLAGTESELTGDSYQLGRAAGNDIAFDGSVDRATSGRHAVLRRDGDGWVVEDLGSTNGTWIAGQQIDGPRRLATGNRVTLGDEEAGVVFDVAVGNWSAAPVPAAPLPPQAPAAPASQTPAAPPSAPTAPASSEGGFFGAIGGAYRRFKTTRELQKQIEEAERSAEALRAAARATFDTLGQRVTADPAVMRQPALARIDAVGMAVKNRDNRAALGEKLDEAEAAVRKEQAQLETLESDWAQESQVLTQAQEQAETARAEAAQASATAEHALRESLSPIGDAVDDAALRLNNLQAALRDDPSGVTAERLREASEALKVAADAADQPPEALDEQREAIEAARTVLAEATETEVSANKAFADAKAAYERRRTEQTAAIRSKKESVEAIKNSQSRLDQELASLSEPVGRGVAMLPVDALAGASDETKAAHAAAAPRAAELAAAETEVNGLKVQLSEL